MDQYYPSNVTLIDSNIFFNMLLTHPPTIKQNQIELYITGEFFNVNNYNGDPDLFVPKDSEIEMYVPDSIDDTGIQITVTKGMIKALLNTYFNKKISETPLSLFGYKYYIINVWESKLEFKTTHIELSGLKINFFKEKKDMTSSDDPDYIKNLDISVNLVEVDLVQGTLDIQIMELRFFDNSQYLGVQLMKSFSNAMIQMIAKNFFSGTYSFNPLLFNDKIEFHRINFEYRADFMIAKTKIQYDTPDIYDPWDSDLYYII